MESSITKQVEKIELGAHELDILVYMKHDKGFCAKMIGCLKKEYFTSKKMGNIFDLVSKYYKVYGEFPSEKTFPVYIQKSGKTIEDYATILTALNDEDFEDKINPTEVKYITDEVELFAKRSRMKDAIETSYGLLVENKFDEIISIVQDALKFNIDINLGVDLFDIEKRYTRMKEELKERISTGISYFDNLLNGGFCRKEIYCVLGPPGMGKSIFLTNFGRAALSEGYNVVHYSFEMSEERVGLRYDAIIANMGQSYLIENIDHVKHQYKLKFPDKSKRLFIKEFPTADASVLDIEAHLEQLKNYEHFVPDVIIVDYGDIMRAARKTNNMYEEQGWIFRELRGLAIKMNATVLTATQARRDALGKNGGTKSDVGMDQVADSMEKTRILDGLFSIIQTNNDKTNNIIKLWFAKNRNGPSGIMKEFKIYYDKMMICQSEAEIEREKKAEAEKKFKSQNIEATIDDEDDDDFDMPITKTKLMAEHTEDMKIEEAVIKIENEELTDEELMARYNPTDEE